MLELNPSKQNRPLRLPKKPVFIVFEFLFIIADLARQMGCQQFCKWYRHCCFGFPGSNNRQERQIIFRH
jgi:hypothetical protein